MQKNNNFLNERKFFGEEVILPVVADKKIAEAFSKVPREKFVPADQKERAYLDLALPIGEGQTISQPSLVALMTKLLNLRGKEKVLEIGTGSGYQAAILSFLSQEVFTIEILEKLSRKAAETCRSLGYKNIHFFTGDGSFGLNEKAPFDAIVVTAGAKEIPVKLIKQLKVGGRLVIPVGETQALQELKLLTKSKKGVKIENISPVAFVPLVDKKGLRK